MVLQRKLKINIFVFALQMNSCIYIIIVYNI